MANIYYVSLIGATYPKLVATPRCRVDIFKLKSRMPVRNKQSKKYLRQIIRSLGSLNSWGKWRKKSCDTVILNYGKHPTDTYLKQRQLILLKAFFPTSQNMV